MKNLLICLLFSLAVFGCKKDKKNLPASNTDATAASPVDFLSATDYDKLIVQIVYVEGMPPSQTAVTNLTAFLQQRLNKPSGIQISQNSIPAPGKTVYSLDDIKELEKNHRNPNTADRVLTAYIFFADGDYDQNNGNLKVLGVTYGVSSMVIFDKTIKGYSGGLGQPSLASVETSVTNHEFGHVLGLVNAGTGMSTPHQDEPHGKHCSNKDCLMYYATETSDMIANLVNNNIPVLDDNCINDLKAAGGK